MANIMSSADGINMQFVTIHSQLEDNISTIKYMQTKLLDFLKKKDGQ